MTPSQARMARAALGLSVEDLARTAAISVDEIAAAEAGGGEPGLEAKLRATFEGGGVEFLDEDGVRFRGDNAARTVPLDELSSANDE